MAILHGSNIIEDRHQGGSRDMTEDFKFRLCFSGGGFRATFFCIGAYRRLVELGLHERITCISSVSGGSIAAGQILKALSDSHFSSVQDFDERVKIFEELHKITYEQVPAIFMANYVGFNAARDYVKGYESLPTNMHRFWGVWIDK